MVSLSYYRFGVCEPYKGGIEVCDGLFTEEDYVFIATTHGSQKNISTFLEENVLKTLILRGDGALCRDQMFRIICKYYLSPCGTVSSQLPPSSICPEDCSAVEMKCPAAWEAAQLGLKNYNFISCDDTSAFLFPLPSCCIAVVVQNEIPQIPQEEGAWDYKCVVWCYH